MSRPDGGAAFPISIIDQGHPTALANGMTLRDYFAGMALQGLLTQNSQVSSAWINLSRTEGHAVSTLMALMVYELADAMLKARGKRQDNATAS